MTVAQFDPVPHLNAALARPVQILLIEDSPSDVAMTIEALREGRIVNELSVASDGEMAMAMLRQEGNYEDAARPDLIILDLNLPKMDGREVLEQVKNDDELMAIPVVILTSSSAESDVLRSYQLRANSYVTKPVGLDAFLSAVRGIEDFWLSVVRLPTTRLP